MDELITKSAPNYLTPAFTTPSTHLDDKRSILDWNPEWVTEVLID